jgi:hypothetical protein
MLVEKQDARGEARRPCFCYSQPCANNRCHGGSVCLCKHPHVTPAFAARVAEGPRVRPNASVAVSTASNICRLGHLLSLPPHLAPLPSPRDAVTTARTAAVFPTSRHARGVSSMAALLLSVDMPPHTCPGSDCRAAEAPHTDPVASAFGANARFFCSFPVSAGQSFELRLLPWKRSLRCLPCHPWLRLGPRRWASSLGLHLRVTLDVDALLTCCCRPASLKNRLIQQQPLQPCPPSVRGHACHCCLPSARDLDWACHPHQIRCPQHRVLAWLPRLPRLPSRLRSRKNGSSGPLEP